MSEGVFMRFLNLYLKPTPLADEKMGTVSLAKALEVGGRFSPAYALQITTID